MKPKKISQLLIGTNNKGKLREIKALLPKNIKIYSTSDYDLKSPKENGKTFRENSLIKASFFSKKSNQICLSDDSGLEIKHLNNQPGIYSARWAEQFGGFDNAMNEILKKVRETNKGTKARFISSLTIYWKNKKFITEVGKIEGNISEKKGLNGFGYDPIFIPDGYSQTFAEMDYKKKLLIDHRYIAYKKLEKKIKTYIQ